MSDTIADFWGGTAPNETEIAILRVPLVTRDTLTDGSRQSGSEVARTTLRSSSSSISCVNLAWAPAATPPPAPHPPTFASVGGQTRCFAIGPTCDWGARPVTDRRQGLQKARQIRTDKLGRGPQEQPFDLGPCVAAVVADLDQEAAFVKVDLVLVQHVHQVERQDLGRPVGPASLVERAATGWSDSCVRARCAPVSQPPSHRPVGQGRTGSPSCWGCMGGRSLAARRRNCWRTG